MSAISNTSALVSILINNYNYARYLSDAIDSALNQTYPHVEVVVVDDGSTDNSREIIERYGDRIVAVFKENGGQASALNAGFASSHGDIICLLDADDAFLPDKATEVVNLFQANPGIEWVFTESAPIGPSDFENSDLKDLFKAIFEGRSQVPPRKIDFRENLKNAQLPSFTPSTSNLCFSRSLLTKIFPLPEVKGYSGMAITDLYVKQLAVGLSIGCVTVQDLGIYRLHNNFYNTLELPKKRRMFAEIYITTGYWMKTRFPEFKKMSQKLISKGFGTYLSTDYLRGQSTDADCEKMMQHYLSNVSILDKLKTYLMIFYYICRLRFKQFV